MRKFSLATAISLALISSRAHALGLGNIELNSALNQPLDAEIELLSVREGETNGMLVSLASQEAFLRAGIDRPFLLTQLRFNVQRRPDGTPFIQVSSDKPVVEPFLNFLIEVDWPRGRLVREYTVLLDPPVFMSEQAETTPPAEAPAVEQASEQQEGSVPAPIERDSIAEPEPMAEPVPAAVSAPVPAMAEQELFPRVDTTAPRAPVPGGRTASVRSSAPATSSQYTVQSGDALWNIANEVRPGGVTVEQMMLALLRANPDAFIDGNINLVRRGAILRVPDADEVNGMTQAQAVEQVREQNSLWTRYRESRQGVAGITPPIDLAAGPAVEDAEPEVETEAPPAPVSSNELNIVAEEDVTKAVAEANAAKEAEAAARAEANAANQQLALSQEELESVRLERDELQSRVSELEGTVEKMERLITLREGELAQLQARLAEMEKAGIAEPEQAPIAEPEPSEAPAPLVVAEEPPVPAEPMPTEVEPPVAEESVSEPTGPAIVEAQPVQPEPAVVMPPQRPVTAQEPPRPVPVDEAAELDSQSPVERLLANPNLLLAGGAVAVLALLLAFLMIRRRLADADADEFSVETEGSGKVASKDDDDDLTVADFAGEKPEVKPAPAKIDDEEDFTSRFDETVLQSELDDETQVVSEPAQSAFEDEDDDDLPKDDTIAEADVYLAYGLFGQAEDLLKLAVEENPNKLDYRLKLLEAYHSQQDTSAYVAAAHELHERIDDNSKSIWNRAVAMGRDLAPNEPLFNKGDTDEASVARYMSLIGATAALGASAGDEFDLDKTQIINTDDLQDGDDSLSVDFDDDDELEKTGTFAPMGSDVDSLEAEFSFDDMDLGIDDETLAAADAEIAAATHGEEGDVDSQLDEEDGLPFALGDDEPTEISEDTMGSANDVLEMTEVVDEDDDDVTMLLDEVAGADEQTMVLDADDMPTVMLDGDDASDADRTEILADDGALDFDDDLSLSSDDLEATRLLDVEDELTEAEISEIEDIDATMVDESALAEMLDETMLLDDELDETQGVQGSDDTTGIDTGALESLSIEDGDEVDTMLDLAKAYIDMGDQESAASALNEIISVGNADQQREARELLGQIA